MRTILNGIDELIPEKTTKVITFVVADENDAPIPAASLSTLTLTLYPLRQPATTINARVAQNVLNTNNVTVDSGGNGRWESQPADNVIIESHLAVEIHRALFEYTWAGGTKSGKHEIDLYVQNLHRVT